MVPPLFLIFTIFSLAGNHHNQRAPNLPLLTSYNPSSSGKNKTGHQQRKLVTKPLPINSQPWGNLKKHTQKFPLTSFFVADPSDQRHIISFPY
jgi:hypothetical protein